MDKKSIALSRKSPICIEVFRALNLREHWWGLVSELEKDSVSDYDNDGELSAEKSGVWIILSYSVIPKFRKFKADRESALLVKKLIHRAFLATVSDVSYRLTLECRDTVSSKSGLVTVTLDLTVRGEFIRASATPLDSVKFFDDWLATQNEIRSI